jgi:hypothetical protein
MPLLRFFRCCLGLPQRAIRFAFVRGTIRWLEITSRHARHLITFPGGPVVSLTTYGMRLQTVHLTIESIAAGRLLPSRLILWLDEKSALDTPPAALLRLQKRGLEICFCQNFGPHKKYFPYVTSERNFTVPLVTADDDILYPRFWLERLQDAYQRHPEVINCGRARVIVFDEQNIAQFAQWPMCRSTKPRFGNLAIGDSGVLYPPEFLDVLKKAGLGFQKCCPTADDVWLHVQALRAGYKVRQIRPKPLHLPSIPGTVKIGLWNQNRAGGNDRQIKATYTTEDIQKLLAVFNTRHFD